MKRIAPLALLLAPIAFIGCGGHTPAPVDSIPGLPAKATRAAAPIWSARTVPLPLGIVHLVPGSDIRVPLMGAANGEVRAVTRVDAGAASPLTVGIDGRTLVLKAPEGKSGTSLVKAELELIDGSTRTVAFPVIVDALPVMEFTYTAPPGKTVNRVALAGAFNGWSQDKDAFAADADGVFRLRIAIAPGTWTYKFVVDGEWMADPSNPEKDSGGYGNSILRVAGEKTEVFDFGVLAPGMPGAGAQGGFRAILPAGDSLGADSVTVIANNRLLDTAEYTVDPGTGVVSLNVATESWGAENFVAVVAASAQKRAGASQSFFTWSAAPRSPRDEVIYFTMTDRFRDGDPALNKPADDARLAPMVDYMGGDWAGIRQKIEEGYFTNLGVTSIWISPPYLNTPKVEQESVPPGNYFTSYHGYWPISSTETNPQFGSMSDLRAMVKSAHGKDIAVLIDFVANHVHQDHPLIRNHPEWAAPLLLPNGTQNIRKFDEHPFTTWFDTFLPTLDYDKDPRIADAMIDNAVYWLRETGADGFRHDAVKHIPEFVWRGLTERLNEYGIKHGRDVYQVGETISGYDTVARFVGPDLLTGQFDFPGYFTLRGVLAQGTGSMTDLADSIRGAARWYPPSAIMSPLIGNHDVSRIAAFADGDLAEGVDDKAIAKTNPPKIDSPETWGKIEMAYAYLMALDGPPTLYYGDEIGLSGASDPDNRRPMPWDGWTTEQVALHDAVGRLGKMRGDTIALRRGATEVLHADAERLVLARIAPEETVIVLISRKPADGSITVNFPAHWGTPESVEPLESRGITSTPLAKGLTIADGPSSYGFWKLKW